MNNERMKVTLVRSLSKKLKSHQACVRGLGLKKIGDTQIFDQISSATRGMINRVAYLLKIEN